jgi:hypothetical protein
MEIAGRRMPKMLSSRPAWLLAAAGLVLAGTATFHVHAPANAEEPITWTVGPGRHFFMFIDHTEPPPDADGNEAEQFFDAEARILQNGREIVKLASAYHADKYTTQWIWRGHADEQIEVTVTKITYYRRVEERYPPQTLTLPVDRNTCYKRQRWDLPMEKVGDSTTGNCTPG